MKRVSGLAAAALLALSCGGDAEGDPRDQWLVSISTDAPVPQFGDRLVIELLDESGAPACPGCRRLLGVPEVWPATFGIAASAEDRQVTVRVRLYRTGAAGADGLPGSPRVIDSAGFLPAARGLTPVHIHLAMDCFGVPVDLAQGTSCASAGESAPIRELSALAGTPPQPGDWLPGVPKPCSGVVPDGMACIEGGAFLMGSPKYSIATDHLSLEPLVVLSPFALDVDEMTVSEYLALASEHGLRLPSTRSSDESSSRFYCAYEAESDANREMSVNCVDLESARAACAARGMRLPTEAEFEFAAGNSGAETRYPWGEDTDACAHAVLARNPVELSSPEFLPFEECRNVPGGLLPPGPVLGGAPTDVTQAGVRNLGGNLSEWVEDSFADYSEACWSGAGMLVDPVCTAGETGWFSRRGGGWSTAPVSAVSYERNSQLDDGGTVGIGLRCALSL